MSADTLKALEDALAAHFSDEMDGGMMSGFICQMQGVSLDPEQQGVSSLYRVVPVGQSITTTLGLIEYIRIAYNASVNASWGS